MPAQRTADLQGKQSPGRNRPKVRGSPAPTRRARRRRRRKQASAHPDLNLRIRTHSAAASAASHHVAEEIPQPGRGRRRRGLRRRPRGPRAPATPPGRPPRRQLHAQIPPHHPRASQGTFRPPKSLHQGHLETPRARAPRFPDRAPLLPPRRCCCRWCTCR